MQEVFRQLGNVTAARRIRLHLATGLVPNVIWIVLFMGALLTMGFTLFFGSENLLAQVSMTGVLSVLVTMGLVVIISIDHPFTGPIYIHPDALKLVLADYEAAKRASAEPEAGRRHFHPCAVGVAHANLSPAASSEREAAANDGKSAGEDWSQHSVGNARGEMARNQNSRDRA
jgi:hypothetical protein